MQQVMETKQCTWTGLLEWNTGLDYWNGTLDWTTGMEYWTGLLE